MYIYTSSSEKNTQYRNGWILLEIIVFPFSRQLHVVEFQSGTEKYQDIVEQDKIRAPNTK